jgi:hypothetical protein
MICIKDMQFPRGESLAATRREFYMRGTFHAKTFALSA